jgi:hypothetical protein
MGGAPTQSLLHDSEIDLSKLATGYQGGPVKFYESYHPPVYHVREVVRQERLAVCGSCELLNAELRTCGSCGCFVPLMAMQAQEYCPEGKWQAEMQ